MKHHYCAISSSDGLHPWFLSLLVSLARNIGFKIIVNPEPKKKSVKNKSGKAPKIDAPAGTRTRVKSSASF